MLQFFFAVLKNPVTRGPQKRPELTKKHPNYLKNVSSALAGDPTDVTMAINYSIFIK